jgi:cobalt-zinc-cadmium efflux system outer membrane protein
MKQLKQVIALLFFSCLCFLSFSQKISLKQALLLAVEQNPDLKIVACNVTMHEADTITAALRPNPIFNTQDLFLLNSNYFPAGTSMLGPKNRQTWFQLTKPFVLPAQRKNKIVLAHQNLVQEQKNYKESERNVLINVANQWINVWYAQKQLDILKEAKENLDSLVLINNLRYKNQVISHSDLMRVELLANQFSVKIKTATQSVQNAMTELRYSLGGNQNLEIDTTDNLIFTKYNSTNYDSLLRFALMYRSDIQVAKSTIDVANANIKFQKTQALPTPELGFILNPQNTLPYAGFYGTLVFPIFSRNQGEIKKSSIIKYQSEIALQANEKLIQTELLNAYQMFKQQKENLEKYRDYIQLSDKILANVRYNYLAGGTNIVDYLEAQRSWIDTQQQFFEIEYNFRGSLLQMLFTAGIIQQIAQ